MQNAKINEIFCLNFTKSHLHAVCKISGNCEKFKKKLCDTRQILYFAKYKNSTFVISATLTALQQFVIYHSLKHRRSIMESNFLIYLCANLNIFTRVRIQSVQLQLQVCMSVFLCRYSKDDGCESQRAIQFFLLVFSLYTEPSINMCGCTQRGGPCPPQS